MHVSAKDKATGKEQKIRIEASSGLTEQEIERMVNEAEVPRRGGCSLRKEKVERRNHADAMVFEIEKQLKEFGDKFDPATGRGSRAPCPT